ncbi:H2O-forming NADH oxidase [Clostridium cylindrosporum]|uniref:NADH oxidase n=1 Tax=Clostridium cylindrosporum DSM 605 TaxID=1121307 RepID=A0A0J8D763_CLOCY|nr:FAD-dependent oxidoreductase [Clostridium cylindrosporum]KMT21732.1 putative NADH oxidase [Clostridium cylindrosporum DSM 605]
MAKIIVVGANHAGTAAINTILDNYKGNEVVVFDRNSNISFLGCGMALWIGEQIPGPSGLFYSSKEKLEEKGAKIFMETEVENIDFDNKTVYAMKKDGTKIEESYDKLILATGSLPIRPNIPGTELENVQFVKLYQDAEACVTKLKDDEIKNVAVVGAGYIGVELAEAFERKGKNVTLIDCSDTCLSKYYDSEFTELMKDNLESHGIKLAFGEMVKEIKGDKRVESIVTDKAEYPADMVVLAIGFKPNNAIGKDKLKLYKDGPYLVDRNQQTSISGVYAIGDCATVYDNSIEDVNYIALATNAVRSGVVAGHNICGTDLQSIGVQGSNGICIYDLKMVSTGLTEEMARNNGFDVSYTDYEDLQKPGFIEKNEKVKIRITYDKKTRRVLGAQIASKHDISMAIHMFSLAIQEKVTIDKLKLIDIFFLPHFNQPYNYINMAALSAK